METTDNSQEVLYCQSEINVLVLLPQLLLPAPVRMLLKQSANAVFPCLKEKLSAEEW